MKKFQLYIFIPSIFFRIISIQEIANHKRNNTLIIVIIIVKNFLILSILGTFLFFFILQIYYSKYFWESQVFYLKNLKYF